MDLTAHLQASSLRGLGRGAYVEWFRLCGAVCGVIRALLRI